MLAKTKGIVVAGCVSLCTLSLLAGRSGPPPVPRVSSGLHPVGVGAVLVEAFVVEVNLPALTRLDVSPIGAEPNAVSVADLLQCIDTGEAQVIGGDKAVSQADAKASVRTTRTRYVRSEPRAPQQAPQQSAYQTGETFSVDVRPVSETVVSVQFSLGYSRPVRQGQPSDALPGTENLDWTGAALLGLGQPQIVAATQDSERAVFLLLTAHAQTE